MPRFCEVITTPKGNTARLQLFKPWHQLTDEQRLAHIELIDVTAAQLAKLPQTNCPSCGTSKASCRIAQLPSMGKPPCCESCDHTPRPRTAEKENDHEGASQHDRPSR